MYDANGRVRRWLLVGSLLLNLFLAAVLSGQYLHHREENAPILMRVLQHVTSRLDAEDAQAFRDVIRQEAPRYAQANENLARARAEIDRQLLASTFDPVATQVAIQHWQSAWDIFVGAFSTVLVDALGHLSPEGRRALVNAAPHQRPDL